jgi:tetratricopeptide (TPR) repeat protein/energy-coupling factor transporter ATP-binding protein EcfA2
MKTTAATPSNPNPFPGLRPFDASEDHLFFGRDGQSEEILTSLRRNRFVAVVGTSGSGKSSLIRAGLLPLLHGGFMAKTASTWRIAVMRPGNDPIGNLAKVLTEDEVLGPRMEDPETSAIVTESSLRRSGLGLIEAVRLARIPEKENLLIVVDQFEELFRFLRSSNGGHAEDDAAFVKLLMEATRQTEVPIFVVITMRSDFIGDCARFRELPETINRGLYLIPIMTRDQRREAITGPAAVAGTQIEPRLINRLLNDAGENPEQLPLLQHALMRTWAYWQTTPADGQIDMESYEAVGAMEDALSRHADEAYDELPTERSRNIAEKIFKALAEKGPDNREVRRPTSVSDLAAISDASFEEVIAVIEAFRQPGRSFLMPPPEVTLTPQTLIDISHESLIRGWRRLSEWVESETISAGIYKRVAETAVLYDKGEAGLWHDPDLQVALGWQDKTKPNEAWGRRYHPGFSQAMSFLAESMTERDRDALEKAQAKELLRKETQRARELRRTRVFATALSIAFVLATGLGVWAMTQTTRARQQETRANQEAAKAVLAKNDAERARAEAVSAKEEAVKQRDEAEKNKKIADEKTLEAENNLIIANEARREAAENAKLAQAAAKLARREEQMVAQRNQVIRAAVAWGESQDHYYNQQINNLADRLIELSSPREAVRWRTVKAQALTNLGSHDEAAKQLTLALEVEPNDVNSLMSRGYMYMLTEKVPESIGDFDRIIAKDPKSSLAYLNRAISQGIIGKYADASASIQEAISDYMPGTYTSLSENEVSPQIQEAIVIGKIMATESSFQTALRYQLVNIEAFRGGERIVPMLDETVKGPVSKSGLITSAYLTAINWAWLHMTNRPEDYGGWVSQGATWEHLGPGYCSQAAYAYEQFRKEHATKGDARYTRLAAWAKNRAAQLDCSVPPAPTSPNDPHELALAADYSSNKGDYKKAEELLTKAIDLEPDNITMWMKRAQVRNWQRKFSESKADAEKALALAGDRPVPKAYLFKGLASGDMEARERELRIALRESPTDVEIISFLGQLVEEKNPDEAISLVERAIELDPSSDALFMRKARLQEKAGRYREALQSVETAIAINRKEAEYYDYRATIERKLAKSPTVITSNLVAGYNDIADLILKRGDTADALDAYVKNLNTLAAAAKEKGGTTLHADMVWTLHKIARLIEQQGASREKVIEHLKVLFGDVKELEAALKEEVNRLTS